MLRLSQLVAFVLRRNLGSMLDSSIASPASWMSLFLDATRLQLK